jgi:hypothetical protein
MLAAMMNTQRLLAFVLQLCEHIPFQLHGSCCRLSLNFQGTLQGVRGHQTGCIPTKQPPNNDTSTTLVFVLQQQTPHDLFVGSAAALAADGDGGAHSPAAVCSVLRPGKPR